MTSYIQTTAPVQQQERLNLQMLNWVLPLSVREEVDDVERREVPECNNGAKWSCSLLSLSSTKDYCTSSSSDCKAIFKKPKSGTKNSLDMCTETLGCENGTMYSTDDCKRDGLSCGRIGFVTQEEAEERRRERKAMVERRIKRVVRTTGTDQLPPPALTTRTSENFLNIVRERDNGRMVMYAVRHQSTVTAERRDGRLKLRLLSGCSDDNDDDDTKEIQDLEDECSAGEGVEREEMETDGNGENGAGDEVEGKKYVFVGRCKEEDQKRDDWTPLMVARAI